MNETPCRYCFWLDDRLPQNHLFCFWLDDSLPQNHPVSQGLERWCTIHFHSKYMNDTSRAPSRQYRFGTTNTSTTFAVSADKSYTSCVPVYIINKLESDDGHCPSRRDLDYIWLEIWLGTVRCAGSLAR